VKAMIQWADDEDLPIDWIGVDMETPVQMADELTRLLAEFKLFDIYALLWDHRDPLGWQQSVANYQELVDYCHDHDFKVHAISFPFALDDYADDDFGLQDAFDIVMSEVEWDEVDFMVYRTMYRGATGLPFTSDMVYRYAQKEREIWGDKASVFIGLVLWDGWFEGDLGYAEPVELEQDIEAALAAGISRIHVFYLTGLLEKDDPEAWMEPDVVDYEPPVSDPWSWMMIELGMPLFDVIM